MQGYLILGLALVLWILYHKIFSIVYFNAPVAILREIVVCVVLSILIIGGITSSFQSLFHHDGKENSRSTNSTVSTEADSIFNSVDSSDTEPHIADRFFSSQPYTDTSYVFNCWGSFYNESFLEGVNGNGFETWLSFEPSENLNDGVSISGYAFAEGFNFQQDFYAEIPTPESNTFTCEDPLRAGKLTITFHPETHTLEVTQEVLSSEEPSPYEGSYVDGDTWAGLLDERRAARQEIQDALQPDYWMEKYYGAYVLEPFADGVEGSPYLWFIIEKCQNNQEYFEFSNIAFGYGGTDEFFTYEIPFSRKGSNSAHDHIEFEAADQGDNGRGGVIAFDILEDSETGLRRIELTSFPYENYKGIYVSALNSIDPKLGALGKRLNWDGTYTYASGNEDGTKKISITQTNESTLSVDLFHTYADGRQDSFHADAEIGAYNDDPLFAAYSGEKTIHFRLTIDPATNRKAVDISQTGIIPSVDKEFTGLYTAD